VAHSLSAKKRIRQNAKAKARNRWRKDQIKEVVREFDSAIKANDKAKASEQLKVVFSKLDKVAARNTIHKNAAARKKARLAKKLNALD